MIRNTNLRYRVRGIHVVWTLVVVLALPVVAVCQDTAQDNSQRLSREFVLSATGALASMHSLKQNMIDVISKNLPRGYYNRDLAVQSFEKVREAQANSRTNGDQSAGELLNSYAKKLQTWGEGYRADRQSMDASRTMGENNVTDDPDLQSINQCEQALNAMLKRGSYRDDISSCR